jgi:NADPH:quinone reductase-like Zn-dependent oxidoreductase
MRLRCGVRTIAVCSPRNFDLVKQYGAEAVFDYNIPTCGADIRAYTRNRCKYALDCITEASTMQLCYEAIGRAGGHYCSLEPYPERQHTRKAVHPDWVLGLTMYGKKVVMDGVYGREASMEDYEFGRKWFAIVQQLLDQGKLRTHPLKYGQGGFQGVLEGVDILRKRMISGQKLIYRIS